MVFLCCFFLFLSSRTEAAQNLPDAEVHLLSPKGIEFRVKDVSGMQRVGFHYSVNAPLQGSNAAQYNYDEFAKLSDGYWHHRDTNVKVQPGDTIHFWLFYEINGRGHVKTDLSWTVTGTNVHHGGGSITTQAPHSGAGTVPHSNHQSNGTPSQSGQHQGLRLIFEDNFDNGFDTSKWSNEISAFGGGNWEFQIYSPEPANTYVKNGALHLKPTLTGDKFGEDFLFHGILDVKREWGSCTKSEFYGCLRNSKDGMIPPIMSSKVISKTSFKYGRVEIEAQMPIGDWLWTSIWLMPKDKVYGGWPRSGEIDITENRCNRNYGQYGIQRMMSTLHWGPAWNQDKWATTTNSKWMSSGNWGDDYHLYTMDWDESGIILSVDNEVVLNERTPPSGWWRKGGFSGNDIWTNSHAAPFDQESVEEKKPFDSDVQILSVDNEVVLNERTPPSGWWRKGGFSGNDIWTNSHAAPFDQEFFLQMNVAVGGTNGFFPDGVQNGGYSKPWSNNDPKAPEKFWAARHLWHPTWEGDKAAMKVRAVRIYQKV